MPELNQFDVSYNSLKDLDFFKNVDAPNLFELNVKDNDDLSFKLEDLKRFTELEVLNDNITSEIWKEYQKNRQSLIQTKVKLAGEMNETKITKRGKRAKAILAEKLRTDLKELEQVGESLLNAYQEKDQEAIQLEEQRSQLEEQRDNLATEKSTLQTENSNLNQTLKDLAISLGQKRVKNRNLTKWKKMLTEAIQTYQTDLASRHSELQTAQTEIKELKQNQQRIRELIDNYQQKQKDQQKTIQQLKTEKQNWQQREKELLAEIELLKNPPNQVNKENIQVETNQYQEQVKELVQKLPPEQIKTINLLLQEQKNKFNQQLQAQETKINLLDKGKQRERERERERERDKNPTLNTDCGYNFSYWWVSAVS